MDWFRTERLNLCTSNHQIGASVLVLCGLRKIRIGEFQRFRDWHGLREFWCLPGVGRTYYAHREESNAG